MHSNALGRTIAIVAGGVLTLGSLGCASDGNPADTAVSGTATYRERIALPANAVFEATLENVSRADAPAEVIGQTRIDSPGNPPIAFSISYDPALIDERNRYAVRARITVDDRLLFTTDTHYRVLAQAQSGPVEVLLRQVGASPEPTAVALENTYWKLVQLGQRTVPAPATDPQRQPHLQFQSDRRVSGFAGCNQVAGSYESDGEQLKFGQLVGTMMACAQGMELEQSFHQALRAVTRWRIAGTRLELLDATGAAVVTFEAALGS